MQLVVARLPLALAAGDGGRAVGRAARDLIQAHLLGRTVRQADDHHAQMQQRGVERGQRCLLSAMLTRRAAEDAANLADKRPFEPEVAGLIEEIAHLRGHVLP